MESLTPEEVAALARAARFALPPERLERVGKDLEQLLRLHESLQELGLDDVAPLTGPPAWR